MGSGSLQETGVRGSGTRDWWITGDSCAALRARGVSGAGYTSVGARYEYVRLSPIFSHVGACVHGHVDYLCERGWVRSGAGTVLVAPAHVPHGSRAISPRRSGTGRIAWVMFDSSVERPSRRHAWDTGPARLIARRDVRPLYWALQGLYVEASVPRDRMDTIAVAQWCDIVVGAADRLATAGSDSIDPTRAVWEEVDADLRHPWTSEELASLANLSETHFRRVCRATLGVSPVRHLTQLRMRRAAMLLSTTRDKLAVVAEQVGYSDVFAFSVAFKRYSGVVPSRYRGVRPSAAP